MAEQRGPVTLRDLLQALARSRDLRSLARECGLTVTELRRRLEDWRQELGEEQNAAAAATAAERASPAAAGPAVTARERFPELKPATSLTASPLPAKGRQVLEAWTDGASRGNPGPAAIGIVFRQEGGEPLCAHAEAIGRATNNVAEYRAVIRALEFCKEWGISRLHLYLDSELIARQLAGRYQVRSQLLQPLYRRARHLACDLREFRVRHVARERNSHADHMANLALAAGARSRGRKAASPGPDTRD
jgi:ribonuclease HI